MKAREFFQLQLQVMALSVGVAKIPLDEFLEQVSEAEESLAQIEDPEVRTKASAMFHQSVRLARTIRGIQDSVRGELT